MPENKVVDMAGKPQTQVPPPVTDFWFAQVDTRLSRIEMMVRRLEWHIWAIFCGLCAVLVLSIVEILSQGA